MKLTNLERETIIIYNQEEKVAAVYTCDPTLIRKLDKLSLSSTEIIEQKSDENSKMYIIPKKWVKITMSRKLSEEKRLEYAERAKQNFKRKLND